MSRDIRKTIIISLVMNLIIILVTFFSIHDQQKKYNEDTSWVTLTYQIISTVGTVEIDYMHVELSQMNSKAFPYNQIERVKEDVALLKKLTEANPVQQNNIKVLNNNLNTKWNELKTRSRVEPSISVFQPIFSSIKTEAHRKLEIRQSKQIETYNNLLLNFKLFFSLCVITALGSISLLLFKIRTTQLQ